VLLNKKRRIEEMHTYYMEMKEGDNPEIVSFYMYGRTFNVDGTTHSRNPCLCKMKKGETVEWEFFAWGQKTDFPEDRMTRFPKERFPKWENMYMFSEEEGVLTFLGAKE
jgi:hypothetical protein